MIQDLLIANRGDVATAPGRSVMFVACRPTGPLAGDPLVKRSRIADLFAETLLRGETRRFGTNTIPSPIDDAVRIGAHGHGAALGLNGAAGAGTSL